MRKFLFFAAAAAAALCTLTAGCSKETDYIQYISERRENIYLYDNDGTQIKIYCSQRETPFITDGIKGNMCSVTEIFVSLPESANEVTLSLGDICGEMSYRSVENDFYLSCSDVLSGESVRAEITADGRSAEYELFSVLYDGVITCDEAAGCVAESEREKLESMTENGIFRGEIFVRLIYDGSCYYYVGICDRDGGISAYLLNGESGRIIAVKSLKG